MDNAIYATLTRQSGLMREMRTVANNIANVSTTGFRREGVIFSEYLSGLEGNEPSLSMARAHGRMIDRSQGGLTQTGGAFDFAIEGEGFFMIETPQGNQLTRAGSFIPSAAGELLTPDGYRLLDSGGTPVAIPSGASSVALAADGTLSNNGQPIAQVGVYLPTDPSGLRHVGGTRFTAEAGAEPVEGAVLMQGFLEDSNVDPVTEIARMIEVQRAYEMGQAFLEREDERIRSVIQTLAR
ncbi:MULTISPECIES: flagellar hook-basal body complex protein [unclassified Thioclava]|uniref:flagellar hook-basal body complex protein n=1 Tax=unclassified Thioclava TaxID=2621713 RepID=UPI000B5424E9|nr:MULTISPECIES: flagellar hook-basal body complex protein [unclassified Thioclava]OWY02277.1 flagellar basal-body rod protein FlgF [Thioclava sp. IC9]OWY08287.1 flagellar basal-body rod protein FlgF [Thioclava sp. F42-5]